MTLPRGSVEILRKTDENGSGTFSEYTEIEIDGKELSSATVSKRLKELVALDALEETVVRTDSGRKTTGYELTERGEKIIRIANEFEQKLEEME